MKFRILAAIGVILLVACLIMPGCKRVSSSLNGSGKIIDQDIKISDFTSINAKGEYSLIIQQGETYKVTVSLDDNLFKRLQVSLDHKTLQLGIEAPANFFPTALKVNITMPILLGLNFSDGAKAVVSGFKSAEDFNLTLSGKSLVEGALSANNMVFNLSDHSKVVLSGSSFKLELNSLGESVLDMSQYELMRVELKMDEGSVSKLNVSGQFDVDLKNKSQLFFSGKPIFTQTSVTGGSTMQMIQK
jgi:hypothetical protein